VVVSCLCVVKALGESLRHIVGKLRYLKIFQVAVAAMRGNDGEGHEFNVMLLMLRAYCRFCHQLQKYLEIYRV
jgi:hypothetical protein